MTCPQCGAQNVPEDSATCPWCGRVLVERAKVPVVEAPSRRPAILAGILLAVVVVLVAVVVAMSRKPAVTQGAPAAPPMPGPPVTQAPAPVVPQPGPPVTQAPAANVPPSTPPDPDKAAVQAYLTKVSYIEKQRQGVVNDLSEALLVAQMLQAGLANPVPPDMAWVWGDDPSTMADAKQKASHTDNNQAQQTINNYVNKLRQLDAQLRATQPVPRPAFDFARAYDNAFATYAGAMVKIGQIMNQGLSDPNQAQGLATQLNALKGPLDVQAQQGLAAADQQLTALCARYSIPKPFEVTDKPSGGVTGL